MEQLYQLIYTSTDGGAIEIHDIHQENEREELSLFYCLNICSKIHITYRNILVINIKHAHYIALYHLV
jgi:hypothetical protein